MAVSRFYERIKSAKIEREVEDVYNQGLNIYFPSIPITHEFACDGFINTKTLNKKPLILIIEYKYDELLKERLSRAKVLCQVLFYLKRFEENGKILPNVCMVADINECFVITTNTLLKYLDEDVDWTVAPSSAHIYNMPLVAKIAEDNGINPFVYDVNDTFSFKSVAEQIIDIADNVQRYVHITEHNISTIFDYFCHYVIKNAEKISAHDLVGTFIGVITDTDEYYQHPTKRNILVTPNMKIDIVGNMFTSFFSFFNRQYTPKEKARFTAISDRLIEDAQRRNHGDFFTPTIFVDYAHQMIEKSFGEDWKEKFVVWDCACGTKNLTRDYQFKELYCSTLEQSELDISEKYNKEATSFQFDFLNDELSKCPNGLFEALEHDKPIIFFINPPYATSSTFTAEKQKEDGCCNTITAQKMRDDNLDLSCRNLLTQFLYRIVEIKFYYNLSNVHIAIYCKPNFICANSFANFRKLFFNNFSYNNGIYFNASEFANVSDKWGIAFEIWNCGKQNEKNSFTHKVVENNNGSIVYLFDKNIYNSDGLTNTSEWVREISISKNKIDMPVMKSGVNVFENPNKSIGQLTDDAIGCYYHIASDVYNSAAYVALFTANCSHPSGKWSITKENFNRIMPTFASRKLIADNWYNDKDIFLAPDEKHIKYNEFVNDSIVYSLFNSASNQSSLRSIEYRGKKWNIKNEFFWMGREEIERLANEGGNDDCYNDAHGSKERFVFNLLQDIQLSAESQAVIDKANELTIKSFKYRNLFNESHPEYQINNWDCGFYQLKALWKEFIPEGFKEFQELYRVLADKMRPMVYELGFLK